MAVKLRLPEIEGLPPVVVFHREHPADPMLILQVPSPGATDSETYRIRLDRAEDRAWMERLKGSRFLQDMLMMEMHVAYEPGTGAITPLPDEDAPSFVEEVLGHARQMAGMEVARREQMQRRVRSLPAMSRHRMRLLGHVPGLGGEIAR